MMNKGPHLTEMTCDKIVPNALTILMNYCNLLDFYLTLSGWQANVLIQERHAHGELIKSHPLFSGGW